LFSEIVQTLDRDTRDKNRKENEDKDTDKNKELGRNICF
jgi:hypothetical protein